MTDFSNRKHALRLTGSCECPRAGVLGNNDLQRAGDGGIVDGGLSDGMATGCRYARLSWAERQIRYYVIDVVQVFGRSLSCPHLASSTTTSCAFLTL